LRLERGMIIGFDSAVAFAAAALCVAVGIVIFSLNRRSMVHAIFASGMILLGSVEACAGLALSAHYLSEVLRWERLRLLGVALLPGVWLLFSLSFGRANSRETVWRWKWIAATFFVVPLALATLFGDDLFAIPPRWNEFVASVLPLGWSGRVFHFSFFLCCVIVLMNLEATLRGASGTKRWRMKFLVLGVGSWFAVQVYLVSQTLLFSAIDLSLAPVNSWALLVACALILLSLFRDRLLSAEVYFSPTLLYNSIALSLVGAYLIAVGIMAKAIDYFGESDQLSLATLFVFLSLVGLAAILLSDQLRLRVRRFVSQNFARPRYDYRKEWMTFTERTTSLLDAKELCTAVARRVAETFGVPAVTIWLVEGSQDQVALGGSTLLSESQLHATPSLVTGATNLVHQIDAQRSTIDFMRTPDGGFLALQRSHGAFFSQCEVRYAVPLVATSRLLGVMTLAGRATTEDFSLEDFDLLKTVADQVAGSLLNLELSRRLLKAKEMEAFQTLSAFFTHDLKNLASMLSLTVQNLPANYDNPQFREDALRVISESVVKMNAMCSRLGTLTKELELDRREIDLNELVKRTLVIVNGSLRTSVAAELRPVPKIAVDPEQIEKVLVNLLLNANEAAGDRGEIRVATDQRNDWVVLTIADNGCGMSEEFIARSLFQPFQTTKSQGLGIGLFQSRRIVEAHRGRIEVESVLDKGSTFRIELPVK
jgi:putative PEP-CTERM system histidine kinase